MKKLFVLIFFFFTLTFLHAGELVPDPAITIGKLDNGLTYYIKKNTFPENRVYLRLAVKSGSIDETENQRGLAHFLEHMAFNGTEKFPGNGVVDFLEKNGVTFGPDVNAYTSFDRTVYMINLPAASPEITDRIVEILSQWAGHITLDSSETEKERGVVLEEMRRGKGADERISRFHTENLFKDSVFQDRDPIGDETVLRSFSHQELESFYKEHYRPDLMAVIAVGDFDEKEMEKSIKKYFSPLKKGTPVKKPGKEVPVQDKVISAVYKDKEADATAFTAYFRLPHKSVVTEQDYRETVVRNLFSTMLSGRYSELRNSQDPPFVSAHAGFSSLFDTLSFFTVSAVLRNDSVLPGAERVTEELARVLDHGFTPGELSRAKAQLLSMMEQAYNEKDKSPSAAFAAEYIRNFLDNETIPGIEKEYEIYAESLPAITLEEVNSLRSFLAEEKGLILLLSGTEKALSEISGDILLDAYRKTLTADTAPYSDNVPDEISAGTLPPPGKTDKIRTDDKYGITTLRLSNGARVIVKPTDFRNDQILFSASSDGGNSLVSDDEWASSLVACAVAASSGIGEYGKSEMDKLLMGKNVSVAPFIDSYHEGFTGSSSTKELETAFKLIYLYFTQPRFDKAAYGSYMERLRNVIMNREATPNDALAKAFHEIIYDGHNRGRRLDSSVLNEISFEKCAGIFKERFADPGDFTFVFVGNADVQIIREFSEKYIGSVGSVKKREKWADDGKRITEKGYDREIYSGRDDKSQVLMVIKGKGGGSLKKTVETDALAYILDMRLREKIREEMGGTYSISAFPSFITEPENEYLIYIMFGCSPDRAEELKKSVIEEIGRLSEEIPEEYLEKFKAARITEYENSLKENHYWLNAIGQDNYKEDYKDKIMKLKVRTLQKKAGKILDTSDMLVLTLYPEIT